MIFTPVLPATATDLVNTTGQTMFITLVGGTTTSIKVGAPGSTVQVATTTPATVTVLPGQAINITYSVVPTAWYWSPYTPAVPATTVAAVNTTGQTLCVVLAGGTTTVIAVNGVTVGTTTPAQVALPPGGSIAVTYSAAPVWAWINPGVWLANAPSSGSYYSGNNTVVPSGPGGYSMTDELAYAQHAEGGLAGLGTGVSN